VLRIDATGDITVTNDDPSHGLLNLPAQNFGQPSAVLDPTADAGIASTFARSDHNHGPLAASSWGAFYAGAAQDAFVWESFPSMVITPTDLNVFTSGIMTASNIVLPANQTVHRVRFWSGATAAVGITHLWAAVYQTNVVSGLAGQTATLIAQSADMGAVAWPANTPMDFVVEAPSGSYIALMCAATTVPSLLGRTVWAAPGPDPSVQIDDWWWTGTTVCTATAPATETIAGAATAVPYMRVAIIG
jgi:hypothetical protein